MYALLELTTVLLCHGKDGKFKIILLIRMKLKVIQSSVYHFIIRRQVSQFKRRLEGICLYFSRYNPL